MMRGLALIALITLPVPALAQDAAGYDGEILSACIAQSGNSATGADSCIGTASTACMARPEGQTTVGMVDCLAAEAAQWDQLLNQAYGKALKQAEASDAEMKQLGSAAEPAAPELKKAQRDWIGFRDASCRFQALRFQGGTAGGPAAATCLMQLTAEQALRLRDLLEEGQ